MLLLLGGVSLQRTTTEVKASEISRNLQQAFWGAEAGLDQALTHLRQDKPLPLGARNAALAAAAADARRMGSNGTIYALGNPKTFADGTYGPFATPTGTYMLKVQTSKIEVTGPDGARLTRTFTVTGTSAGRQSTVSSTVVTDDVPLSGIFANGSVSVGDLLVMGSLHTGQGTPWSVFINDSTRNARIMGDVTVGPPDKTNPYDDLVGPAQQWGYADWQVDPNVSPKVGIGIRSSYLWGNMWPPRNVITGKMAAVEMPRIPSLTRSKRAKPLPGQPITLDVPTNGRMTINDGDLIDTSNLSHLPDGKIVLDLDYLSIGYRAQVTTNAPTDVYLRDHVFLEDVGTPLGYGVDAAAYVGPESVFVAVDPAKESQGVQSVYPDGIRLMVTQHKEPGVVIVDQPWAFFGSIYAPDSMVAVEANERWVEELKHLVGTIDLKNFDYAKFYAANYAPGIPGKTKGLMTQYVVSDVMRGSGGCSSLFAEAATANKKANNGSATLTGWHNTQDRVTAP